MIGARGHQVAGNHGEGQRILDLAAVLLGVEVQDAVVDYLGVLGAAGSVLAV